MLEPVRSIHLNPLRAKLVKDLSALDTYPNSGHRMLMGKRSLPWQDTAHVLSRFGRTVKAARSEYREFVAKGIALCERSDLVGGGLVRSMGGWAAVKALRKTKVYMKGDEWILEESGFVEQGLAKPKKPMNANRRCKPKVSIQMPWPGVLPASLTLTLSLSGRPARIACF